MHLTFINKKYGICTIIYVKERLSLVKLGKSDKFLVASDLNLQTGNWGYGDYFENFVDADDFFDELCKLKDCITL